MARMAEVLLGFIRLFRNILQLSKCDIASTACCAVSPCHTSICSRLTEKGRSEGAVTALCSCSGCQHGEISFLRSFPAQPSAGRRLLMP